MPELYRMLGALQQSVEDIRAMLSEKKQEDAAMDKRVCSLESSRTKVKAWIAGCTATLTVSMYLMWHAYELMKELAKR